jgi:LuxR family maltose regulon positive regulatory protein
VPPGERLLVTKLRVPPSRARAIARERLVERLNQGLEGKLTVVSAPAGWGKTSLLSEWSEQTGLPTAWISLDEGDNDPAVFLSYLVGALRELRPGVGDEVLGLLRSARLDSVQGPLTTLINEIASFPHDFALVLDDCHLISTAAVHDVLGFLIDRMPPQMHLFLVGRREPLLPLARLLAGGQLSLISASQLGFTRKEASAFFQETMGVSLAPEEVATLHDATEGWAAGLQLAAISLRTTEGTPEPVSNLSGLNRYSLDYLAEEVLGNQTEEVRGFLLRTSILERLCAPLCEAVTGLGDGQKMLEHLERADLFLVPLDDERRWYRYHHLFSDFLRRSLQESRFDDLPELHRRACDWFERNELAAEAVSHALAAGDTGRAADLVERIARTTLRRGELSTLRRWLEALPDDLVRSRPRLCLYYAWYFLAAGDLASVEPHLVQAERAGGATTTGTSAEGPHEDLARTNGDSEPREILGEALTIRAAVAGLMGEAAMAVRLARRASELLTEGNQFLRCIIAASLGYARRTDGDVAAAIEAFTEAAEASRSVGATYVTLLAYKHLAELRAVQGRLRAASSVCDRALELAAERGGGLPAASVAHVGKGELFREWNDLGQATAHLEKGIALAERGGNFEMVLDGHLALARVRRATGDLSGSAEALRKAERTAERLGNAAWEARVGAWRARLGVARGDLGAAELWMEGCGLSAEDPLRYPREFEHVTLARVLLACGRRDEALRLLERLLVAAGAGGRDGRVVELLVLKALALRDFDGGPEALAALGRAAALAEDEGYVRVFADEGEPVAVLLKRLLREVRRRRSKAAGRSASPGYVAKLLAAMGEGAAPLEGAESAAAPGTLVEPLSKRELEVLALLPSGISNKEIAARLFVSHDTVKSHLKHLYAKLDVRGRAQAVARAKEFGLI